MCLREGALVLLIHSFNSLRCGFQFMCYRELYINLYKTEGFNFLGKLFLVRIIAQRFVRPLVSPFINAMFSTFQGRRGFTNTQKTPASLICLIRCLLSERSYSCDYLASSWITENPLEEVMCLTVASGEKRGIRINFSDQHLLQRRQA